MEAFLRALENDFSAYYFPEDADVPDAFDVVESAAQGPLVSKSIKLRDLIDWANDDEVRETADAPVPEFKMIQITTDESHQQHTPLLSASSWHALFDAFHIGTWLKDTAYHMERGFFQPPRDAMDDMWTFMLNVGRGSVIWSHSAATGCTRAIFLGHFPNGANFRERLVWYGASAAHPLFPGFVHAAHCFFGCLGSLGDQVIALEILEATTGYRPTGLFFVPRTDNGEGHRDLSQLSKDVAAISNMISYLWLDLSILEQVLELLVDYSSHPLATQPAVWKDVADLAWCILRKVESEKRYHVVTTKRVENQMTIIFNLIAREDTAATIRLAEAAKRDSSSMKTLAVMTMAFLPATFLATVFAMPSLTVDQPPGFNVYLAVSIPMTVAIMLAWAAITQRQVIRESLRDVRRRRKESIRPASPGADVEKVSMEAHPQRTFTRIDQEFSRSFTGGRLRSHGSFTGSHGQPQRILTEGGQTSQGNITGNRP